MKFFLEFTAVEFQFYGNLFYLTETEVIEKYFIREISTDRTIYVDKYTYT